MMRIPVWAIARLTTAEGVARYVRVPIDERAARVLLPGPDVQRIERRQSKSIGTLEQVKELAHQLRRLSVRGVPRISEDQIVRADQLQTAIGLRLVDHNLRSLRVENTGADERSIHVMQTHRAGIGPADASELQHVAFGLGHANILKTLGRVADDLDQRAGLGLFVGRRVVMRRERVLRKRRRRPHAQKREDQYLPGTLELRRESLVLHNHLQCASALRYPYCLRSVDVSQGTGGAGSKSRDCAGISPGLRWPNGRVRTGRWQKT